MMTIRGRPFAGLYAILDWPYPHDLAPEVIAEALIQGGAALLQLRAKQADSRTRAALLDRLAPVCAAAEVPLILNDDLDLVLARADAGTPGLAGVHLGQTDLDPLTPAMRSRLREAGLILGVSTHTPAQVELAIAEHDPDYLGFGPIFATASKVGADPTVGLEQLSAVLAQRAAGPPIVAIGGIDRRRAPAVGQTGVAAMAAIATLIGPTPAQIRRQTEDLARAFRTPQQP